MLHARKLATCAAALLTLALSQPVAAQQDEPQWMACITDVGGADLPARVLDDFLAAQNLAPPVDGLMGSILSSAILECGQRRQWSQEQRATGFSYALIALAAQEALRRLDEMGVSETFRGEMIELHRGMVAGRYVDSGMDEAFARELARGEIDLQEQQLLATLLVVHASWAVRRDHMPTPE